MKAKILFLVASLVVFGACKKSGNIEATNTTGVVDAYTPAKLPTASFRIANTYNSDGITVLEGRALCIENTSENAESYSWSFGATQSSTEKFPTQVSLSPCSGYVTVKLTTKNRDGKTATMEKDYYVLCSRGITGGRVGDHNTAHTH